MEQNWIKFTAKCSKLRTHAVSSLGNLMQLWQFWAISCIFPGDTRALCRHCGQIRCKNDVSLILLPLCYHLVAGFCQGDGFRVGFGECRGKISPANVRWYHSTWLMDKWMNPPPSLSPRTRPENVSVSHHNMNLKKHEVGYMFQIKLVQKCISVWINCTSSFLKVPGLLKAVKN